MRQLVRYRYVVRDVDRYGNARFYYRRKGQPKIKLTAEPGTAEFLEQYEELLKSGEATTPSSHARTTGIYGWLIDEYLKSTTFKRLDKLTQNKRRQLLMETRAEPVAPGAADTFELMPLSKVTTANLRVLRDRKAHVPHAQINRVKAIKVLFKWGAGRGNGGGQSGAT